MWATQAVATSFLTQSQRGLVITCRDVKFFEQEFPLTCSMPSILSASSVSPRRAAHNALTGSRSSDWKAAFEKEMANMHRQQVWELVPRPKAAKVMQGRWVLKEKDGGALKAC